MRLPAISKSLTPSLLEPPQNPGHMKEFADPATTSKLQTCNAAPVESKEFPPSRAGVASGEKIFTVRPQDTKYGLDRAMSQHRRAACLNGKRNYCDLWKEMCIIMYPTFLCARKRTNKIPKSTETNWSKNYKIMQGKLGIAWRNTRRPCIAALERKSNYFAASDPHDDKIKHKDCQKPHLKWMHAGTLYLHADGPVPHLTTSPKATVGMAANPKTSPKAHKRAHKTHTHTAR